MVRLVLQSDFLSLDQTLLGPGVTQWASRRGRKVLEDVSEFLRTGLQSGMERNGMHLRPFWIESAQLIYDAVQMIVNCKT